MNEAALFMEEILKEAEAKEEKQSLAYFDLLIAEVIGMQEKIDEINEQAEREIAMIEAWKAKMTEKYLNRIEYVEKNLEAFIRERGEKTIDLAHGTLKIRKKPDRVKVQDMDLFLSNANAGMLKVVPEQFKPDLTKIKAHIKKSGRIPEGIEYIEGEESFSLTIKKEN